MNRKKSIKSQIDKSIQNVLKHGDGFVDREEYQKMVEDMAALSPESTEKTGPLNAAKKSVQTISKGISEKAAQVASVVRRTKDNDKEEEKVPVKEYGSMSLTRTSHLMEKKTNTTALKCGGEKHHINTATLTCLKKWQTN